jgi:hypothetical protein
VTAAVTEQSAVCPQLVNRLGVPKPRTARDSGRQKMSSLDDQDFCVLNKYASGFMVSQVGGP